MTLVADSASVSPTVFCPSQNIFAMDLRSAHKVPEKPSSRLRLSLTRSMSTDVDQGERGSMYRRLARRKSKQRVSKRGSDCREKAQRPRKEEQEEPMEQDWASTTEEKKQEPECITEETHQDSLCGWFRKSDVVSHLEMRQRVSLSA